MAERERDRKIEFAQTLTERDYREAGRAAEETAHPSRRRWVRVCACLTAAGFSASLTPASLRAFRTALPALLPAAALALLALAVWAFHAEIAGGRAGRRFRACPLLALPQRVTLGRDRAVVRSEYEKSVRYWTEFPLCVETPRLFAAAGGQWGRALLIVRKDSLPGGDAAEAEKLLAGAFGRRYCKIGKRGERRWNR